MGIPPQLAMFNGIPNGIFLMPSTEDLIMIIPWFSHLMRQHVGTSPLKFVRQDLGGVAPGSPAVKKMMRKMDVINYQWGEIHGFSGDFPWDLLGY